MQQINRRHFIKGTAIAGAAISLSPRSWGQTQGSNDALRVAVVGFNGRGKDHISGYKALQKSENVRIVALCDVDSTVLSKGAADFEQNGQKVETYKDIRKLLENKDVDIISIATPNHWHALAAIWSVQAGKDVYLEKPVSHNVSEGRRIVEAARKYNKIVQTGTQSRSSSGILEAVEWIKAGNLGKIVIARGLCYKPRPSIGKSEGEQPIPASIDYDLWCGPAAKLPLNRKKLHYDWHWVWNTGSGDLGNQGIHQMDICRWFLGEQELAPRVFSVGGRLGYDDDGETPNTMMIFQDYAKAPLIFEVRGLPEKKGSKNMGPYHSAAVGCLIECENGHVLVPDYTQATVFDKEGTQIQHFKGSSSHFANFIKAVRSRKQTDLTADILQGHLSSALCHTGNISYRVGSKKAPGEIKEAIKGDKDATNTFDRMAAHLEANEVDLNKSLATLGMVLKMDTKSEKFLDNPQANALLTREYRKPFVVPEKV
ncbi:MAG: iolG 16 [Verrucomicrobiales bacterium]|nr:iolG 16 [Verrucomicrobiales bacterium]